MIEPLISRHFAVALSIIRRQAALHRRNTCSSAPSRRLPRAASRIDAAWSSPACQHIRNSPRCLIARSAAMTMRRHAARCSSTTSATLSQRTPRASVFTALCSSLLAHCFLKSCPPNWLRIAASIFAANESESRDAIRASSASVIAGAGTSDRSPRRLPIGQRRNRDVRCNAIKVGLLFNASRSAPAAQRTTRPGRHMSPQDSDEFELGLVLSSRSLRVHCLIRIDTV